MTSIVSLSASGSYTTAVVAITTPWPYTAGCDTQFAVVTLGPTTTISAFDPSLGGIWNYGPTPRYYSQTQCLWPFLSPSYGQGSTVYEIQDVVCPESWTKYTYSTSSTPGVYIRPYESRYTCCPPKYTLSCASTFISTCYSSCLSPVTRGQTIIAIPDDFEHIIHTGIETEFALTTDASTIVATASTVVTGYMITATSYITYPAPTYTYNGGSSSSSYDDYNADVTRYWAIRLGVGIAVPVATLIIAGIILFVLLRRRRRRRQAQQAGIQMTNAGGGAGLVASKYHGNGPSEHSNPQPNGYPQNGPNQYAQNGPNQYAQNGPNQYAQNGPNQYAQNGPNQSAGAGPTQYSETVPNQHSSGVSSPFTPSSPNHFTPSSPHQQTSGVVDRGIAEAPGHPVHTSS